MRESGSGPNRQILLSGRGLQYVEELNQLITEDNISNAALDGNRFSDPCPFPSVLCNLQVLDISHNLIYTLQRKPFQNLLHLRVLNLAHNSITTIEGLEGLPLQHLDLSHNSLCGMKGFDDLLELRSLDLSFNDLEQIDDLSRNRSLEFLNLSSNFISTLQEISDLLPSSLRSLNLSNNSIGSIQSLTFLSGMNSLQALYCVGNPFLIVAADGNYNYRSFVCFILPSISTIDGSDPSPIEIQEGQRLFCEPDSNDLSADVLRLLDEGNDDQLQAYLQSICPIELNTISKLSDIRENLDEQSSSELIRIDENNSDSSSLAITFHNDHELFYSTLRSINASLSAVLEPVPTSGLSRWNLKSVAAIVIQSHWRRKRIQSVYKEYQRHMKRSIFQHICNIPAHRILQENACVTQTRLQNALEELSVLKQRLKGEENRTTAEVLG